MQRHSHLKWMLIWRKSVQARLRIECAIDDENYICNGWMRKKFVWKQGCIVSRMIRYRNRNDLMSSKYLAANFCFRPFFWIIPPFSIIFMAFSLTHRKVANNVNMWLILSSPVPKSRSNAVFVASVQDGGGGEEEEEEEGKGRGNRLVSSKAANQEDCSAMP